MPERRTGKLGLHIIHCSLSLSAVSQSGASESQKRLQGEDMQKEASNTELKKGAPPDDDFAKDFFDSWKSEKLGNESMDFDMETIPKNKKPSFKFDELDNFELSGNFDKLSSFKLDVPDLDFSGPSKKNEKTHEKSSKEFVPGKKESKENKFSFDFDFNSFDIASKSLEERSSNLPDKKVQEHSSKLETNQVSNDRHSDYARKTEVFLGKRSVIAEDNEKQTNVTLASHEKYLPTENSDNDQDVCLQTSSEAGSADIALHGIQTGNPTLNIAKLRTKMEKADTMHLISSSPSRSSSPVCSYSSAYWTKPSGKELPIPGSEIQKHQSREPLTRICGSLTDSFQIRKQVHDSTGTKRSLEEVKDMDPKHPCKNLIPSNKQSSPQKLLLPSAKREHTFGGSSKLSGLMNTGFQLNNISKLGISIRQQSPAFMSKPLDSMLEARTKITHDSTSNDSSLQFKTSTASHQPSVGAKSIVGSTLQKLSTDATADLIGSPAGYNRISFKENSKSKFVPSTRLGSQNIGTNKDTSLGDNNHCGILNSAIAKTIEVNNNKTNSSKPRETKSVHFLEKRLECPSNAVNSVNIEKHVSLHAPLKRKIDEESVSDLQTSSPLKCVKESTANKRISIEQSQTTKMKMVPEIKITETCNDVTPVANRTSIAAPTEMGNLVTVVSSNVEDEENLRKTETLTKDLDKICSILRKQHEEAKELQVRSIINNNALLLLNHSVLEENIQALQKFTASLLLMEI